MTQRTRVAVLGGGAGGCAAALELTATPALRERFEVTVHQLGWRLGGKGASGRNPDHGERIEEHGLHLWFGFYDNAFRVMRDCYTELGRPPSAPLATLDDAFKPCDTIVLYEHWRDRWIPRVHTFAENDLAVGHEHDVTLWSVIAEIVGWLRHRWEHDVARVRPDAPHHHLLEAHALAESARVTGEMHDAAVGPEIARLLHDFVNWLWSELVEHGDADLDDDLRCFCQCADIGAAMVRGILDDHLVHRGLGAANDEDLRAWLGRHGAHEQSLADSPLLRGFYDLIFGYVEGDVDRPDVAAGAALSAMLRIAFDYKQAILFKMQAGMGDTVFGPMYEVLRARGVDFRFFSAVSELRPDAHGTGVGEIDVIGQATVKGGGEYEPLVDVRGLPCWPSDPLLDQLVEGDRLRGVNLEQVADPLGVGPTTLRAGEDFDQVVLAIPAGALAPLCAPLVAAQPAGPLATALACARTVMTQAFQLWLCEPTGSGLGWQHGADALASSFTEPLDTYCDMSHLIGRETWGPGDEVASIGYFCGVLPDTAAATQEAADASAHGQALDFLRSAIGPLWPAATAADGALRWDLLAAPGGAEGEARFDAQYWRGNFQPTERYVLTPAGTVDARLRPGATGFDNLAVAGDWTRNDIDGGSVEGAVTSGIWAARALTGDPTPPLGVTSWMSARGAAR